MRKIEMVSQRSKIVKPVSADGEQKPRVRQWLITVTFSDGTERHTLADGKCWTFIEGGFLVAFRRQWQFYDAELNKVATLPKSALGNCVGVSYDFYAFKDKDGEFLVDNRGKRVGWQHPWTEIPAEAAFECGTSYLREKCRRTYGLNGRPVTH